MKKTVATVGMLIGCAYLLLGAASVHATVFLMDRKLLLNGYFKEQAFSRLDIPKEEEQFHESKFDLSPHQFIR